MKLMKFFEQVGYKKVHEELGSECWFSKFDDSYMTHVGMEDNLKILADLEITIELTHGVGKSQKDGKWYGWSHRAIFGFDIGSTCEKGDCHYVASTPEELIESQVDFWSDFPEKQEQVRSECQILEDRSGIRILHTPIKLSVAESVDDVVDVISGDIEQSELAEQTFDPGYTIIKCGRGEWIAETEQDAKQMAIDFNEGVS